MMYRNILQNLTSSIRQTFLRPYLSINGTFSRFEHSEQDPKNEHLSTQKNERLKRHYQAEAYLWYTTESNFMNPEKITEAQWQHLYELETRSQRQKYCKFLNTKTNAKQQQHVAKLELKKESKKRGEKERAENAENQHIIYRVGHNSLHLRISKQSINKWLNIKLSRAKLFGQKVIIDCSYDEYMTALEQNKTAKHLERLYSENRKHSKPFDLHICGVAPKSPIIDRLCERIPTLLNKGSLMEVHSQCFTELFSKERMVMLTPDSEHVLKYNCQDIYIVGGIVEHGRSEPLTLAKAKKLGIRTAKLPMNHVRMRPGDIRELTVPGAIGILREYQLTNDIKEIFKKCKVLRSDWKSEI